MLRDQGLTNYNFNKRRIKLKDNIDTEVEIWKDFQGHYQVSNLGNVWSNRTNKMIRPVVDKGGYLRFGVTSNGKRKHWSVHRAVAVAFIPNLEHKPCVNHDDGNKLNNRVDNLSWVSYSENMKHACETGLLKPVYGENNGSAKLKNTEVIIIREMYRKHAKTLAEQYNVSVTTVNDIIKKKYWKHVK